MNIEINAQAKSFLLVILSALFLTVMFEFKTLINLSDLLSAIKPTASAAQAFVQNPFFHISLTFFFSLMFSYHVKYAIDNSQTKDTFSLLVLPVVCFIMAYAWRWSLNFYGY